MTAPLDEIDQADELVCTECGTPIIFTVCEGCHGSGGGYDGEDCSECGGDGEQVYCECYYIGHYPSLA